MRTAPGARSRALRERNAGQRPGEEIGQAQKCSDDLIAVELHK
jgi:hypothetical protein